MHAWNVARVQITFKVSYGVRSQQQVKLPMLDVHFSAYIFSHHNILSTLNFVTSYIHTFINSQIHKFINPYLHIFGSSYPSSTLATEGASCVNTSPCVVPGGNTLSYSYLCAVSCLLTLEYVNRLFIVFNRIFRGVFIRSYVG